MGHLSPASGDSAISWKCSEARGKPGASIPFSQLEIELQSRDEGMDRAAQARSTLLALARFYARRIATNRHDRCCDADQVQAEMQRQGYSSAQLGNAAGSIFRGKHWQDTGRRMRSERAGNHAREIRIWRLR